MPEEHNRTSPVIPVAIVLAGAMIAGAFFLTRSPDDSASQLASPKGAETVAIRPVTQEDHILGNPQAQVIVVEYSDFECPFCGQFHNTMHRIMDEYGKDGRVAWVYRHFPIEQLHQQAWQEAEASECVAHLAGNEAFWDFADLIFASTPGNDGLDLTTLPDMAEQLGVSREQFNDCLSGGQMRDDVEEDYNDAVAAGGRGTPHNVIVTQGKAYPIEGAQPYTAMKTIIETVLAPQGAAATPPVE